MKAYLERAREHDLFMKEEKHQFEIGKRHLANMMGEPAELFENQEQIDVSCDSRYFRQNLKPCSFRKQFVIFSPRLFMTKGRSQ